MHGSLMHGSYQEKGYLVLPGFFGQEIDELLADYVALASSLVDDYKNLATGEPLGGWQGAWDPHLKHWYKACPEDLSYVYDECKKLPGLDRLAVKLHHFVDQLVGPCTTLPKKPFRIDLPRDTKELAHWHQDRHYLEKEGYLKETVCAWIPLQDVSWLNGCLSVMPFTHKVPVEHDIALGKKQIPSSIFSNPVLYMEMKKGDVLLFSSLLLHSGNMNFSDKIRYSVQIRFEPCQPVYPVVNDKANI